MKILAIIVINLIFFWRTINYHFTSDDLAVSKENQVPPKNKLKRFWNVLKGHVYSGKESHAITLSTHTLCCVLIYIAFGRTDVSFLAAVLFSINPVNCQGGSVWLSGRQYCYATIFSLLIFAIPLLSPLIYIVATYLSIYAAFTPIAFLKTSNPFFIVIIFLLVFNFKKNKRQIDERVHVASNEDMATVSWKKLIIMFKTYGYYFRICVFPYRLGLYHEKLWALGVTKKYDKECYKIDTDFWVGLMLGIASCTYILIYENSIAFGLLWFNVSILMWTNFITIHQPIAERYCYLPNVGMMLVLASIGVKYPYFGAVLLGAYAVRLSYIMPAYISEFWSTHYNLIEQKRFWYVWLIRGVKRFKINDDVGAYNDFCEAYRLCKHSFKINFDMANMSILFKNLDHAQDFLNKAKDNTFEGEGLRKEQLKLVDLTQKLIDEIHADCAKGIHKNYDRRRILIVR